MRDHGTAQRQLHPTTRRPPIRLPPRSIPPRDRYRNHGAKDDLYDGPDDDDPYGEVFGLDQFDNELLQQPVPDRLQQAALDHRRLSLHPSRSKYVGTTSFSQADPTSHYLHQDQSHISAQYVYVSQQPDTSSDAQLGASSSPALRAGQRRAHKRANYMPQTTTRLPTATYHTPEPSQLPKIASFQQAPAHGPQRHAHDTPVIQGIPLVSTTALPDRLRSVFTYPLFNAVQSKCIDRVFKSDDNFVLASPTGSGKTAVLELAICRAFAHNDSGQYKIVYQAPIKALCSERQRDWQKKFSPLGLTCVELTGDSDASNLRTVQTADIIVTTPEKWDSITRKWKDHERLMRLVKLFLIDEVHILKEDRGAILEAVVSRMKTIGTDVRFVALSATVPNLDDVASWLGKNPTAPYLPANSERFGEEFRPVKLKKHVCGYQSGNPNDFAFESTLDSKLPEVISKYSEQKPIMVFCMTRKSTMQTAKMLADWWSSSDPQRRYWKDPSKSLGIQDQDLRNCIACGVAFHHAGLESKDRFAIEKGFLDGDIGVICCTSTLAVGVNLPCHFVIIKHTVTWTNGGLQEYSDLEIMQMIGRAGRPQFDTSAVAVIMTRQNKIRRYETMVSGQEVLESRLHVGLVEHLNAEIGLGTICDLAAARNWLSKTFFYVRLRKNPSYYKLEGARSGQHIDEQLDDICLRDLSLLQEANLVEGDRRFRCTQFGEAMARYYVKFETMQIIIGLPPKAQISEILSALSQAAEFKDIRFRAGEKALYRTLNTSPSIRFPIPVSLDLPAHKVSLIIQSVLGSAEIAWEKDAQKIKGQYHNEVFAVFRHVHRLIRCIADCQIGVGDSVALLHALLIQRSLRAQAWDDGPLHMRQLEGIGVVAVRKLVNAGIRSIEDLEYTYAHRIEMILGRNPPFGLKLLEKVKLFPKPRVSVQVLPKTMQRTNDGVKIQLKIEVGLMNEKPLVSWQKQPVYICCLAETSDGSMLHFARISAQKLGKGQDLVIPAVVTSPDQSINCYVMCDEIAGTMREASVKPRIAPTMFPASKSVDPTPVLVPIERPTSNTSKRRTEVAGVSRKSSDEFDDGSLDDDDLIRASFADLDFEHIENYANPNDSLTKKNTAKNTFKGASNKPARKASTGEDDYQPIQLENGKWTCRHKCGDKTACRHLCCREGVDRPHAARNRVQKTTVATEPAPPSSSKRGPTQTKLQLTASKRKASSDIQTLDLTQPEKKQKSHSLTKPPRDIRNLNELHKKVLPKDPPASLSAITHTKPAYCYVAGGEHDLSFLGTGSVVGRGETVTSTDYGDL
ncbi:P-loop containing nucleoside triphosphate hydrolase protein, partial [Westerdykella ornata]